MTTPHLKHQVTTDALDTLGSIITENEKRDAVHLAVEPVIAAHGLLPGDHVGLTDGKASRFAEPHVGIVDPFLTSPVKAGERFWLVVYPRQIKSLRHVWEHPAFPLSEAAQPSSTTEAAIKAESENWLREFLGDYINTGEPDDWGETFESIISRALSCDNYLTIYGSDANGPIPDEFWHHVQIFTGTIIPPSMRAEYFSCSC